MVAPAGEEASVCAVVLVPVVDPGTGPDLLLPCPTFWPLTPRSARFSWVLPVSHPVAVTTKPSTASINSRVIGSPQSLATTRRVNAPMHWAKLKREPAWTQPGDSPVSAIQELAVRRRASDSIVKALDFCVAAMNNVQ